MLLEMQHVGLNDAYRNGVWSSRFRGKMDDDESQVLREDGKVELSGAHCLES